MQDWNTGDMIFDVPALIEFLSGMQNAAARYGDHDRHAAWRRLRRTPPVWLKPGDTVSIEIEKIGTLTNPVMAERNP